MKLETAIKEAARIALALIQEEKEQPVLKYHSPQEYNELVDLELDSEGATEENFFNIIQKIASLTPKTNSRAFYNQLFGGRSAPSLTAEIVSTVLNTTMHTYKVAGIQVLVEQNIIKAFLEKVGFEQGDGTVNPGGSLSNMVSMMIARNEKSKEVLQQGLRQQLIAYTSDESHYSIKKNAGFLGIGRANVREIPTDDQGQMLVEALAQQIEKDKAEGGWPFYINATAGTTVLGAFDPIDKIAKIAAQHNIWLHVDAALGGSVLLTQKYKHLMQGVALADSVTWNAHKLLNAPLTASFLLIKEKGLLEKHLSADANYLFQNEATNLDLGKSSVQCERRLNAFKVWAAWKYYGAQGLAERVCHLFDLAQYATQKVRQAPNLALFRTPISVTICFTVEGVDEAALCQYLHQQGMAMVGYSSTKGSTFVRMACINADLTTEDVDYFFEQVQKATTMLKVVHKE